MRVSTCFILNFLSAFLPFALNSSHLSRIFLIFIPPAQLDLETSPRESAANCNTLRCWPLNGHRQKFFPSLHHNLRRTAKKRGTESCPRRFPQQMPVTKSPNHHLFHPADMPNNLTSSFLARSRHPKTERKKLTMKSSLVDYGSRLHHDLIISTVMVNHLNCLIPIMILSRRDGPGAQKTSRSMVNGIEKGNANGKEKRIEIHGNGNGNLPIPRVEATPGNFLIIAKTTLFVSPFWPARRPHNKHRLK